MNYALKERCTRAKQIADIIASCTTLGSLLSRLECDDLTHIQKKFQLGEDFSYHEASLLVFVGLTGITSQFFGNTTSELKRDLKKLSTLLVDVDQFYKPIGGLIGYYIRVLELLNCAQNNEKNQENIFLPPPLHDVQSHSELYWNAFRLGLENLHKSAEVYVVGGAGDRLNLHDEKSQVALPAARLNFLGRTLLEGLIRDLEAKEYLAYKLLGLKVFTPILLMTSSEKHNDEEILRILQDHSFFGRPRDSFFRIIQPLVPLITEDGLFASLDPGKLVFKPGGHGVIWKLLKSFHGFDWLKSKGYEYLSLRQINNPLGFVDCASIVLLGLGAGGNKSFGFAGCKRDPQFAEGVNVLQIHETNPKLCSISNYEYTKSEVNFDLSACPANTNILYASISAIEKALEHEPFPGSMVNMGSHRIEDGDRSKVMVRLESTMQNISDSILDEYHGNSTDLSTFLALFQRNRLISVTKRLHGAFETPERAFFDFQKILKEAIAPSHASQTYDEYLKDGPNVVLHIHPALGPLSEILNQKIKDVVLHHGSELELELAEAQVVDVDVQGSLQVISTTPFLRSDPQKNPACILKNVRVRNKGIAPHATLEMHWQRKVVRTESCVIRIHGNGVFIAEDVEFTGPIAIEVHSGYVVRAISTDTGIQLIQSPIPKDGVFQWSYQLHKEGISLQSNRNDV